METRGRGFWLHQLVEYVIAILLIVMSAQIREPLVPVLFGVALLLNTAVADGAMSAFKLLSRGMHRLLDWLIIFGFTLKSGGTRLKAFETSFSTS